MAESSPRGGGRDGGGERGNESSKRVCLFGFKNNSINYVLKFAKKTNAFN